MAGLAINPYAPYTAEETVIMRDHVAKILTLARLTPAEVALYVSTDRTIGNGRSPMDWWIQCFTHKSLNPKMNYEAVEFFGDRMLKSVFPFILEQYAPNLTPSQMTDLDNYYMSRRMQSKYSEQLGLTTLLKRRSSVQIDVKIQTDVLEAFFGTVCKLAENYVVPGSAESRCRALMTFILSVPGNEINMANARIASKTGAQQTVRRLVGLKDDGRAFNFTTTGWEGTDEFRVGIDDETYNRLNEMVQPLRLVLDYDMYPGVKLFGAGVDAYDEVFRKLNEAGITVDYVNDYRKIRDRTDRPGYTPSTYLAAVETKLRENGLNPETLQFEVDTFKDGGRTRATVTLNALDNEGYVVELDRINSYNWNNDHATAKLSLLQRYAAS